MKDFSSFICAIYIALFILLGFCLYLAIHETSAGNIAALISVIVGFLFSYVLDQQQKQINKNLEAQVKTIEMIAKQQGVDITELQESLEWIDIDENGNVKFDCGTF